MNDRIQWPAVVAARVESYSADDAEVAEELSRLGFKIVREVEKRAPRRGQLGDAAEDLVEQVRVTERRASALAEIEAEERREMEKLELEMVQGPSGVRWGLRPEVTSFQADWESERPVIHAEGSRCVRRSPEAASVVRDMQWFRDAVRTNRMYEENGAEPTFTFCTSCVLVKVDPRSGLPVTALAAWLLRDSVEEVAAYWPGKAPVVHDAAGRCLRNPEDPRGRAWLEGAFRSNIEAEALGEPRTYHFCTRCVIYLPKPERPATRGGSQEKAPSAVTRKERYDEVTGKPAARHGSPCPTCFVEMGLDGRCSHCDREAQAASVAAAGALKTEPKKAARRTVPAVTRAPRKRGAAVLP